MKNDLKVGDYVRIDLEKFYSNSRNEYLKQVAGKIFEIIECRYPIYFLSGSIKLSGIERSNSWHRDWLIPVSKFEVRVREINGL